VPALALEQPVLTLILPFVLFTSSYLLSLSLSISSFSVNFYRSWCFGFRKWEMTRYAHSVGCKTRNLKGYMHYKNADHCSDQEHFWQILDMDLRKIKQQWEWKGNKWEPFLYCQFTEINTPPLALHYKGCLSIPGFYIFHIFV